MSLRQLLILIGWLAFNALVTYSVLWSAKEVRAYIKAGRENK